MNNYKLIIQYDGTQFSGWQIQNNTTTVQGELVKNIGILIKEEVNLIGSGRTDTGVHALGQVANFRTEQKINIHKFVYSLNSLLPESISIIRSEKVTPEFHSRFDAKRRSYLYLLSNSKSPFYYKYSNFAPKIVDLDPVELNEFSKSLLGSHDFTSFSKKNVDITNKNCNIYSLHWRKTKGFLLFYIEADRFLHGMVRTIVGTIVRGVQTKTKSSFLLDILEKKNRESAWESYPAKGLFLYKVRYR